MTQAVPAVRPARNPSDGLDAAKVLLAAIGAAPLAEWLLAPVHRPEDGIILNENDQLHLLLRLLKVEIGYYNTFGGLLLAGDPADGVAAWALADVVLTREDRNTAAQKRQERLEGISAEVGSRILAVDAISSRRRPPEPRIHLAYLAALDDDDDAIRAALLAEFHSYADKAGVVACADATDEGMADWYAEHGWAVGEPYDLPDDGPRMWPVSRSPRPGAA